MGGIFEAPKHQKKQSSSQEPGGKVDTVSYLGDSRSGCLGGKRVKPPDSWLGVPRASQFHLQEPHSDLTSKEWSDEVGVVLQLLRVNPHLIPSARVSHLTTACHSSSGGFRTPSAGLHGHLKL